MNLKTVLGWLILAFIVWWIIADPTGAAHVVRSIAAFFAAAAHGLSTFFSSL